jgi:putative aldouronate transport system substrate-binding protein
MKKTIVAVLAAVLLFSGCSKSKSPQSGGTPGQQVSVINMVAPSIGPIQKGIPEVEAAINAIVEPAVNVRFKLTSLEIGSYSDQVNLMLSSGEKVDLVVCLPQGSVGFNAMISQNQLADIADPVASYGQEIIKTMDAITPGLLEGTTVGNKIFGITSLYNKVSSHYWLIRKDLLSKHNIDISGVKSLDDMENILDKMKAAEPFMSPLVPSTREGVIITLPGIFYDNSFADPVYYDHIGDQVNRLAVVFNNDVNTVVNAYKSDIYRTALRRMRSWYQKGYIYKDTAINTELGEELMRSGKGFSYISESELGVEANKSSQTGHDLVAIKLGDTLISTGNIRKMVWAVPSTSKEADAAIKFLSFMYTDERIVNLFAWGIEGRDYIGNPDGTVMYPSGIDANTVPYHTSDFLFGNQYICKVWQGSPPDLREQARLLNQRAPRSQLLGFSFDTSSIINEISAITNVINKHRPGLESGTSDPETGLPNFIRDLDAAGAQRIIDEVQRQYNTWKSAR